MFQQNKQSSFYFRESFESRGVTLARGAKLGRRMLGVNDSVLKMAELRRPSEVYSWIAGVWIDRRGAPSFDGA